MRKLMITFAAISLLAGTAGDLAAKDEEGAEAKCRRWAKEDGVPKEELAEYLEQCIEDLKYPPPEDQSPQWQKGKE